MLGPYTDYYSILVCVKVDPQYGITRDIFA